MQLPKISPEKSTFTLEVKDWRATAAPAVQAEAAAALESGKVLVLPHLPFVLNEQERRFLRPECVKPGTKTVKFDLARDRLWGMVENLENPEILKGLMKRYALDTRELITQLFPSYGPHLGLGNTSFRPVEAEGRIQSKRHDDRLLHVDAFPSRPTAGKRHLRVFTNIHPGTRARIWRVGEPFATVGEQFLPQIPAPLPGSATLLKLVHVTKSKRTPYDHYMLQLHDRMKLSDAYQAQVAFETVAFAPGTTWIVFTDQVSHAAMSGQHALEQTFTLEPEALMHPERSPLAILEKQKGKRLIDK